MTPSSSSVDAIYGWSLAHHGLFDVGRPGYVVDARHSLARVRLHHPANVVVVELLEGDPDLGVNSALSKYSIFHILQRIFQRLLYNFIFTTLRSILIQLEIGDIVRNFNTKMEKFKILVKIFRPELN